MYKFLKYSWFLILAYAIIATLLKTFGVIDARIISYPGLYMWLFMIPLVLPGLWTIGAVVFILKYMTSKHQKMVLYLQISLVVLWYFVGNYLFVMDWS